jgi:hypothetical protein
MTPITRTHELLRLALLATCVAAAFASIGCIPRKLVTWSSDGSLALMLQDNVLYLLDGDGKLSSPIITDAAAAAEWLPDSKRFVVVRRERYATWDEVDKVLSDELRRRWITLAERLKCELLEYQGALEDFSPSIRQEVSSTEEWALILYLRDKAPEGLPERLGKFWEAVKELKSEFSAIHLYEADGLAAKEIGMVWRNTRQIATLIPSNDGAMLAFTEAGTAENAGDLVVCRTKIDSHATRVARTVNMYPCWARDNRSIYYMSPAQREQYDGNIALGTLEQIAIDPEAADLAADQSEPRELAAITYSNLAAVHSLPDGRVIFSTLELSLPRAVPDLEQRPGLYIFDPKHPATLQKVLSSTASEDMKGWTYFSLNPAGTHAVIGSNNGELFVVTIADSSVWRITFEGESVNQRQTLPVWRNNTEVCYVRAENPDAKVKSALMLCKLRWPENGVDKTALSKDWSAKLDRLWNDQDEQPRESPPAPENAGEPASD